MSDKVDSNPETVSEPAETPTGDGSAAVVEEPKTEVAAPDAATAGKDEAPSGVVFKEVDKYTAHYPDWAREFARKYFTKTYTQFIVHGNVRDLVPSKNAKDKSIFEPLRAFLAEDLFAARDIVLFYDRSSGIHFSDKASQSDFNRALSGYDTIFGTDYVKKLPKDPVRVLSVLENYFRVRLAEGKRIACIID